MTSCQALTYEGSTDYTESVYESCGIRVLLGQKSKDETKASGAIDTEEFWKWKDAQIYVYAFSKDSTDFTAGCTDSSSFSCILDGTEDGCPNAGRAAVISGMEDYIIWKSDENMPRYPEGTDAYDFYAYYIDDCKVDDDKIKRSRESISMPVTITGAQDLMTARAVISDAQIDTLGFTENEKTILLESSYSSYSANLGVHPELYFKHHLVRLDFEAYPYREKASEIWIQEIAVGSRTEAEFTVAHHDTTQVGVKFIEGQELVPLVLMDRDYETALRRDTYKIPWDESDAQKPLYERSCLEIGGSLLVSPEESYICTIKMRDLYEDDIIYRFHIQSGNGSFQGGYQYTIRLGVYGRNQIVPEVIVKEWQDDGDYELDVKGR